MEQIVDTINELKLLKKKYLTLKILLLYNNTFKFKDLKEGNIFEKAF